MRKSAEPSVLILALVLTACTGKPAGKSDLDALQVEGFKQQIAVLAADDFDGRKPATAGEEKTIKYVSEQFQAAGLQPGNGSSYFQQVPLVEITANPDISLRIARGKERRSYKYGDDMMVWTKRVVPIAGIENSELVFVGYGIVAPEFGWNDYAAANIKGKTAVILINDPGFVTGDPQLFNGRAMTYHGRWTYKFEEAARQGAAAALIIHDTEPAAYGWEVVQSSWSGPQLDQESADGNAGRVAIEGWVTGKTAEEIFRLAGRDLNELKQAATHKEFKAVPLGVSASVSVQNSIRHSSSSNVVGIRRGSTRPDEYVLYMAHWDHLGHSTSLSGDAIYNGAVDNATGVAALITLAQAFKQAAPPPDRSVIFLAVTAEEAGLLGSAWYASNPLYPLARTAAAINIDAMYEGGPARDISVVGFGSSELEDYLKQAAAAQDRVITPEPDPEKGHYYRSDHFNLAKKGVPALYTKLGVDDRAGGRAQGRKQQDEYLEKRYHKPADEFREDMDFRGSVEDLRLLYAVGYRISRENSWPNWYPGNEFRATRDRSRAEAP